MWKFLIAVIAFGAVVATAQDTVETCVVCQQTENNTDCVYLDNPESLTEICTTITGSCFSRINDANGFIQRGCSSELGNTTACDNELCQKCQLTRPASDPCNNGRFPTERLSCYVCDGERNSTCAELDRIDTTIHAQLCSIFRVDDTCFSTRAAGTVSRGCLSSVPRGRCDHGVCGFCRGDNCNSGEFSTLNGAFTVQSYFKLLAVTIAFFAFISN